MTQDVINYKDTAKKAYKELLADVISGTNYWQVGNKADTLFDYLRMAIDDTDPTYHITPEQAQADVWRIYKHYLEIINTGCWYDDFCWWAIAFAKSWDASYKDVFGAHIPFLQAAIFGDGVTDKGLWYRINYGNGTQKKGGAPNAWKNGVALYPEYQAVQPRFEGGVWQYDMFPTYRDGDCTPSNTNPSNPLGDYPVELGPYQLSVVNGLYFVLCCRLVEAGVIAPSMADGIFGFIHNWCTTVADDLSLLNEYGVIEGFGVIRERVSTYANNTEVNFYNSDNAWTGDQGLFLGGFVDYFLLTKNQSSFNLAQMVTRGVAIKLIYPLSDNTTYVFAPWATYPNEPVPFAGDPGDYWSGVGVFMRYLFQATTKSSTMKELVAKPHFQLILGNTAKAFASGQLAPDPNWNSFNTLSTMLLAIGNLQ